MPEVNPDHFLIRDGLAGGLIEGPVLCKIHFIVVHYYHYSFFVRLLTNSLGSVLHCWDLKVPLLCCFLFFFVSFCFFAKLTFTLMSYPRITEAQK